MNSELDVAVEAINFVVDQKPTHTRKGNFLTNVTSIDCAHYLSSETEELCESVILGHPDINEAADTFIVLLHLCKREGWTEKKLARAVIKKLMLRFDFNPEQRKHLFTLLRQVEE